MKVERLKELRARQALRVANASPAHKEREMELYRKIDELHDDAYWEEAAAQRDNPNYRPA